MTLCKPAALLLLASALASGQNADALYQGFRNPPQAHSLMPYWFWKGRMTEAETRRQLKEMIAQGVTQAIVFPWDGMEIPYLSEEYWKQIGAALDAAEELGFTLNIANEYSWPSSHAWEANVERAELSRLLHEHPEFRMKRLIVTEHKVAPGFTWRLSAGVRAEAVVAARVDGENRLDSSTLRMVEGGQFQADAGEWLVSVYTLAPVVAPHNTRVDLLNPDAVKAWIGMVYEEYARRFPRHFGKTLQLTVADHEGAYAVLLAWTPRLWAEFQSRKGRDLRRELPLLTRVSTDGHSGRRIRRDYMEVVSALYAASFTGQVADWCRRHNVGYGASFYEEQIAIQIAGAGDMYAQWRGGSVVEIDALLERGRMPIDFMEAATVAHLEGKPLVVENQGLHGHGSYFSLEKARLGTNMILLWGAQLLVPYFDYYYPKQTYPPEWFESQPFWRYFRHYADYVRRGAYMNSQGRHVARVALYYPLETAFANAEPLLKSGRWDLRWNNVMDHVQNVYSALQLELARQGWSYHILDAELLRRTEVRGNRLSISGEEFTAMVLPPMTDLAESSAAKLREFIAAGGTVVSAGAPPEGLPPNGIQMFPQPIQPPFMDTLNYSVRTETPTAVRQGLEPLLAALRAVQAPEVDFGPSSENLHASHRAAEGVDWYWVVNDSGEARQAAARFPITGRFEKWDAETGARSPLCTNDGRVRLDFEPWGAFFVVRTAGETPACAPPPAERVVAGLGRTNWRFTPEAATLRVPYARADRFSEPVWLAPERLSAPQWWVSGPYPHDDHAGFFRSYPPELSEPPSGADVKWVWFESPSYTVRFRDAMPEGRREGIYYAFAWIHSPRVQKARARIAFADSVQFFWNGERKLSQHRHQKFNILRDVWAEHAEVELKPGWNRALLKIESSMSGPTGFLFRLVDERGETLRDVAFAKERALLPPSPPRPVRMTVAVPPGAKAVKHPLSGAWVPLAASTREWQFECSEGALPDRPIEFRPGTASIELQSWTDSALAHYSGAARYETEFDLPRVPRGEQLWLDLGEVGLAAEVWVNGRKAGERAWRPFRVNVTDFARPGRNTLLIRVANSSAGWESQGDTLYAPGAWGLKFKTERDRLATLRPNGLEGPVRVVAAPVR